MSKQENVISEQAMELIEERGRNIQGAGREAADIKTKEMRRQIKQDSRGWNK